MQHANIFCHSLWPPFCLADGFLHCAEAFWFDVVPFVYSCSGISLKNIFILAIKFTNLLKSLFKFMGSQKNFLTLVDLLQRRMRSQLVTLETAKRKGSCSHSAFPIPVGNPVGVSLLRKVFQLILGRNLGIRIPRLCPTHS